MRWAEAPVTPAVGRPSHFAVISRGDVRVTDRQVRPNVQSEENLSFGVSEAYELRRGAGDQRLSRQVEW